MSSHSRQSGGVVYEVVVGAARLDAGPSGSGERQDRLRKRGEDRDLLAAHPAPLAVQSPTTNDRAITT